MSSTHIETSQRAGEKAKKDRSRNIHDQLIANVKDSDDISLALTHSKPSLIDLIDSEGAVAALNSDGSWATVGNVPTTKQLDELANWLIQNHKGLVSFHTHELSTLFPAAAAYKNLGSGLLAVLIPKTEKNYIFWFKPEVVKTVVWAGNPHEKKVGDGGRLNPRDSFEHWKESISGKSLKWNPWEIESVLELRSSVMAIDLRRQFEKEQRSRAEAQSAVAAREELVEVVSHDLKNPLSSIFLNLSLLERTDTLTEKQRSLIERTRRSSTIMNNLINDILSVTKLESGLLELDYEKKDLDGLINECIEILGHLALDKKIVIEYNNPFASCEFYFDYGRMLQVFSNIVGNALKFTDEKGRVIVTMEKCGPKVVEISIRDTGIGIPKESLSQVFDRFWQANQTKRLGTGLGLSIVKGIITAHGGEIYVTSELNIGSCFHISLPLKESL